MSSLLMLIMMSISISPLIGAPVRTYTCASDTISRADCCFIQCMIISNFPCRYKSHNRIDNCFGCCDMTGDGGSGKKRSASSQLSESLIRSESSKKTRKGKSGESFQNGYEEDAERNDGESNKIDPQKDSYMFLNIHYVKEDGQATDRSTILR
ncbi:unnamed protein product [Owenia fusiformis]|uniref:Uncharacterized protein n=2 Tax=Owenia fusiformis TaxID=6347 RepID=A0A8S4NWY5_OWEFU|nr:unnamed protein product [Owenia fusiformis]